MDRSSHGIPLMFSIFLFHVNQDALSSTDLQSRHCRLHTTALLQLCGVSRRSTLEGKELVLVKVAQAGQVIRAVSVTFTSFIATSFQISRFN